MGDDEDYEREQAALWEAREQADMELFRAEQRAADLLEEDLQRVFRLREELAALERSVRKRVADGVGHGDTLMRMDEGDSPAYTCACCGEPGACHCDNDD